MLLVAQETVFLNLILREVRKSRDQGLPQNQGEALERSTEKKEGVRKMSTVMEQKESPETRGEMLGKSTELEEEGVRKMSSDMEHKEWSEKRGEVLGKSTELEEEEGVRDMSKRKGLEREECLGQLARL